MVSGLLVTLKVQSEFIEVQDVSALEPPQASVPSSGFNYKESEVEGVR